MGQHSSYQYNKNIFINTFQEDVYNDILESILNNTIVHLKLERQSNVVRSFWNTTFYIYRIPTNKLKQLFEAIKTNTSLNTIDISNYNIDSAECADLINALMVNKSIVTLDISGNNINVENFIGLYKLLKINPSIRTIKLKGNCRYDDYKYQYSWKSYDVLKQLDLMDDEINKILMSYPLSIGLKVNGFDTFAHIIEEQIYKFRYNITA